MKFRQIDKTLFRKKQRIVAVTLCLVFATLGLGISALLRSWYDNPQGENMMVNLAGVLIGLLITIAFFSLVYKHPFLDELRYGWKLKKQVLKIQNHRHRWEALLEQGNADAATVLAFYHKGVLQLQHLDGNDFGYSDSLKREEKFNQQCESLSLQPEAEQFDPSLLLLDEGKEQPGT